MKDRNSLDDLQEEIEHLQKMLSVLRRRFRDRELQAAQYGIDVPPHIKSEMEMLEKQIIEHDREAINLQQRILAITSSNNNIYSNRILPVGRPKYLAVAILASLLTACLTIAVFLSMKSATGTSTNPITLSTPSAPTRKYYDISGSWLGTLVMSEQFTYNITVRQNDSLLARLYPYSASYAA
jgi:hypothetical protein